MNFTIEWVHGFPVRALECPKCGEIELDILDYERARILEKIVKKNTRR